MKDLAGKLNSKWKLKNMMKVIDQDLNKKRGTSFKHWVKRGAG